MCMWLHAHEPFNISCFLYVDSLQKEKYTFLSCPHNIFISFDYYLVIYSLTDHFAIMSINFMYVFYNNIKVLKNMLIGSNCMAILNFQH